MTIATFLDGMKHSPIRNYGGIPGVTSWLIGGPSERGLVRLMECSREHQEPIIPHSHRFHCKVLSGRVRNLIWSEGVGGDMFRATTMRYDGEPGAYTKIAADVGRWSRITTEYRAGDEYSMTTDQVHSIFFSKGAAVLFLEGPPTRACNLILEPFVDGEAVPTFKVEPWAFKRGDQ